MPQRIITFDVSPLRIVAPAPGHPILDASCSSIRTMHRRSPGLVPTCHRSSSRKSRPVTSVWITMTSQTSAASRLVRSHTRAGKRSASDGAGHVADLQVVPGSGCGSPGGEVVRVGGSRTRGNRPRWPFVEEKGFLASLCRSGASSGAAT